MLQVEADEESIVYKYEPEKEQILMEAKLAAENILMEAQQKAQTIHQQLLDEEEAWQQEKLELIEEAKKEGFQMGYLDGKDQGYKEFKATISLGKEVVASAKKDYQKQIQSSEKVILQLGVKVAEQIIGNKLEENEETFLSMAKRALKEASEYKEVQLHIHPKHYGYILSQKEELLSIIPKETDIYIFPNDDLQNSSCIIESANGKIDASVDSQLEEIKTKLLEILESEME